MSTALPDYQDEVQNINNEYSGVVIAVYMIDGIKYFDVRDSDEDHVHYATLAKNWRLVCTAEDIELR